MGVTCDRCGGDATTSLVSRFNTERCCMKCIDLEKTHPKYNEACRVEHEACQRGDYNFEGIGLPRDLEIQSKVILSPQFNRQSFDDGTRVVFLGHFEGIDHYFNPDKKALIMHWATNMGQTEDAVPLFILQCEQLDKKSDGRILMELTGLW